MVTIKKEKRIRLYVFSFCILNFLFFSLRGPEIYFCWVSCFYFCKITVFVFGNAPFGNFQSKTDIYFFLIRKLLFFSLMCFYLQFHCSVFLTIFVSSNFFYWSISFIVISIINGNYNFISNNIKGIKETKKRLKLFEYLKNNINDNGFIFLQETHSLSNDELKWKDEFGGPLFFSHGKSNSCGVAIGYCGTEAFKVVNTACDKNGRILILDAELNDTNFLLINFYNSNTESEKLSTFSTLQKLLEKLDDYNKKSFWMLF